MLRWLLTLALGVLRIHSYRVAVGVCGLVPGALRRSLAASCPVVDRDGALHQPQPSELKQAAFNGRIVVVDDRNVSRYVEPASDLLSSRCVGFDLEYVPDYYASALRDRSARTRPAVIQIASSDICLVYLVYKIGHLPESISSVLRDPAVLKVSHGAPSDMRLLYRHFGVQSQNFVDLQQVCQEMRLRHCSLKNVVEHVLGLRLTKKHQCSNWEAASLSQEQIQYAATDAWVTLETFLRIKPRSVQKLLVNDHGDVEFVDSKASDGKTSRTA